MLVKYYFNDEKFIYEISIDDVIDVASIYYSTSYGVPVEVGSKLIANLIINDLLFYEEDEEFIEFVADYFYNQAKEVYEDGVSFRRDPHGYYGVSEKDFV